MSVRVEGNEEISPACMEHAMTVSGSSGEWADMACYSHSQGEAQPSSGTFMKDRIYSCVYRSLTARGPAWSHLTAIIESKCADNHQKGPMPAAHDDGGACGASQTSSNI